AEKSKEGRKLFLAGKAAMILGVPSIQTELEADQYRKFDFGFFPYPRLTRESVPEYAGSGDPVYISGRRPDVYGVSITKRARQENLVDLTADFIQFWTAPANLKRLVDEAAAKYKGYFFMPTQKGMASVRVPEDLLKGEIRRINMDFWGVRF